MVLVAVAAAGCGGSSPDNQPKTSPSTPVSSGTQGTPASGETRAAIAKAFVDFFAGSTPAARKIMLVQHGNDFSRVIDRQAGSPLARGTTAAVSKVVMLSPTKANVVYTVSLSGTPALKNVTGVAVMEDGSWKVSAQTFCTLLKLEQQAPPTCKTM
jgi:hypothetical protein